MEEKHSGRRLWRSPVLWCLAAVIVMMGIACYIIFGVNRFSLTIRLLGETQQRLEYGQTYEEAGAELWLYGSLFWKDGVLLEEPEIRIIGDVAEEDLGRKQLRYSAQLYYLKAEATRSVHVLDTVAPVLILKDPKEEYLPGSAFTEPGYVATDNHDGDLTDRVVRMEEPGQIVYAVTDRSGNPTVVKRELPGFDPRPPEITLEGGED